MKRDDKMKEMPKQGQDIPLAMTWPIFFISLPVVCIKKKDKRQNLSFDLLYILLERFL